MNPIDWHPATLDTDPVWNRHAMYDAAQDYQLRVEKREWEQGIREIKALTTYNADEWTNPR